MHRWYKFKNPRWFSEKLTSGIKIKVTGIQTWPSFLSSCIHGTTFKTLCHIFVFNRFSENLTSDADT